MATVEQAIDVLKKQKKRLWVEYDDERRNMNLGAIPGGKRAEAKARREYLARVEAIDYALNFLESEEEEPCPD